MCGIVGIWNQGDRELAQSMMDLVGHRGPDAEGIFVNSKYPGVLGHRRLSIMDPKGGDQPIYGTDPNRAIIANGEIYNFRDLRSKLVTDHQFLTNSDTEVILRNYESEGVEGIVKLDGMYAFAIADEEHLILARDAIGIKPLYYGYRENALLFASEMKALAPLCDEISEFPPGHYFHSQKGLSAFYTVPELLPQQDLKLEEGITQIRQTLEEAIVKRLMSDVPLGAFLSGGLDSSIITAIAKKYQKELHTFSVGVEGSRDLEAARRVASYLGTIHHEYIITPEEIIAKLPEIIYYLESYDLDLIRSAIPCYFTSRLAAEYVKVVLSGEGADELFAGYRYYSSITDEAIIHQELRRSVTTLHNINLQRVDRLTMAHGLEGRVPFLDLKMIELGLKIPTHFKLFGEPPVEKWILRKAFEDLLPAEIVWRKKEQFDEGSGIVTLLETLLADCMSQDETMTYQKQNSDAKLRSKEECHYHRLFMDVFQKPEPIFKNVARWSERPSQEQKIAIGE